MQKLGIIGCGRIVEEGHLPALGTMKDLVEVAAIVDQSVERLEKIGNQLGIPQERRFTDYKELLALDDIDVVDVAVPHTFHHQILIDAANAGKHLLSEKPLTTTLEEADEVLAAVAAAGVELCVCHNYLYQPSKVKLLEMIRDGAIGEPFLIRSEGLGGSHWPGVSEYESDWRTKSGIAGHGCLLDNGYHDIYLARAIMGSDISRVSASISTVRDYHEVEDLALVLFEHENCGTTSLQVAWGVPGGGQFVYEVYGTEGTLSLSRENGKLMHYVIADKKWHEHDVPGWDWGFKGLFEDFFTSLERGEPAPVSGADARRNLEIILAAYTSGKEKRWVLL